MEFTRFSGQAVGSPLLEGVLYLKLMGVVAV